MELTRQQGGRIRIRADAMTAITEASLGKDNTPGLIIQLGPNLSVAVVNDTMETIFNKLTVAFNGKRPIITDRTSPAFPGHVEDEAVPEAAE